MPWCPVCKNEYTEGVKVCADCGAALVDSLNERKEVLLCSGEEALILQMQKFMEYNDIPVIFEQEGEEACLYVLPKHEREAKQAARVFLTESASEAARRSMTSRQGADSAGNDGAESDEDILSESLGDLEEIQKAAEGLAGDDGAWQEEAAGLIKDGTALREGADDSIEDAAGLQEDGQEEIGSQDFSEDASTDVKWSAQGVLQSATGTPGGAYRKKSERADDLKGSGEVLLVFGILGCIAMILIDLGILPIRFGNRIMMNVIMFALFLFFIGFGVYSLKGARKFRSEASEEDALTERINAWAKRYLTAEDIDRAADIEDADAEEIKFFKRTEAIKKKIADEFGGVDEAYLDSLAENVYQELFE